MQHNKNYLESQIYNALLSQGKKYDSTIEENEKSMLNLMFLEQEHASVQHLNKKETIATVKRNMKTALKAVMNNDILSKQDIEELKSIWHATGQSANTPALLDLCDKAVSLLRK